MSDNILQKIDRINAEDLYLVEKDLCFHEKVSIAFLLFGDKKTNAQFILQKLLVMSPNPDSPSDILASYTKVNKNWKPFLVEALAIIKANRVLRKLGLHQSEIRTHFLPHIAEMRLHINPILKAMYSMCEMLTPIDAGKLVLDIRDTIESETTKDHLRFYKFEYLEVFLLDWISKRILDATGGATTDISLLIDYCKINDMNSIKQILAYPLREINLETNDSERKESGEIQNIYVRDTLNMDKENIAETYHQLSAVSLYDCYNIKRESAGFVLIINQRDFHQSTNPELQCMLPKKPLQERLGTDIDKEALVNTFASFGYKPIIKDNLTHIEVLSNIREAVMRSVLYDSLIVCILTHGLEGAVYACDSVPIKIDQIEKIITGASLIRKPKMLIIQACQGVYLQRASIVDNLENDAGDSDAIDYGDMIKAMSTVAGFASLRHTRQGSWFIQTLCNKINELGDRDHILDILTEVNAEIGKKRGFGNACMTPISSQTLKKKFRLPCRL